MISFYGTFCDVTYASPLKLIILEKHIVYIPVSYTHLDVYKRQKYNIENNVKLISLDVKDMFINITVNKVIKLINDNNMGEYRYKKQSIKVVKEYYFE